MTKFGKHEKSNVELFAEAAMDAIGESNIERKEIEALFVGQVFGGFEEGQMNIGGFIVSELGLGNIPATRFEGACASAGVALRDAYLWVASGFCDVVLAGGVEKATVMGTPFATRTFAMCSDAKYESTTGITFPGIFAMAANLYASTYGIGSEKLREKMAYVSIKNHRYGALNPKAHFYQKYGDLTVEKVLQAPKVADPLGLLDCCPFSDGAAACVIASAEKAKELTDSPVFILGVGQGSAGSLGRQRDFTKPMARITSSRTAFKMAGIEPKDVDVVELHDCFTIAEIIASEAMGFFGWGEGVDAAEEGETDIGGKIPINVSGGLLGKGHPIGATGAAQVYSIVKQLRGEAPRGTQVDGAEVGMTDTLGGDFGTVCNLILSTRRR